MKRGLGWLALSASLACGGTIASVGDGGTIDDAAPDHAMEASPPPLPPSPPHDAGHGPEAAPPTGNGSACAAAGYHCATKVSSQCPTGSYPASPTTQDCPGGQLCCKQ